jgi:tetratricopeptide (TPR) repeat protein
MNIQPRHVCIALLLLLIPCAGIHGQNQASTAVVGRGVVSLPDKTWGVEIDLSGFTLTSNGTKPDGQRYLLANNNATNVVVSVTLEEFDPARERMTCKEIMNARVADTPANLALYAVTAIEPKNVKIWENGDNTFMEYSVPRLKAPGQKPVDINQRNRFLCFRHEDVFVDVHVSKPNFQPGDEKLFDLVFDSVQIHEGLVRTSMDYFSAGTSFYNQSDFKRAIPSYARALALEQQEPKLEKKFWYVLVDNLGMAYGVTGDLESARKTFEYGIKKDPDYPMFYYEMADYYGEKRDLQNAMSFLQKAWDRKDNLLPGEKFPDARKDDSFKKWLKNPDFQKLAETLSTPTLTHRPSN